MLLVIDPSKNSVVIEKKSSKFAGKSQFLRQNNNKTTKPNNFTRLVSKNSWRGSFYINETKINLNFKDEMEELGYLN